LGACKKEALMKRLVFYSILWLVIIVTAYSFLIPKYYFVTYKGFPPFYRCNRITGLVEEIKYPKESPKEGTSNTESKKAPMPKK
jgi:hypothetical protein